MKVLVGDFHKERVVLGAFSKFCERKRIQISLAATVIYLLFTALVSTVYTLHTSRRRADRTVFSVILHLHKTQINSTMELNIRKITKIITRWIICKVIVCEAYL